MDLNTAAKWVLKRACRPCRRNDAYEHKACIEAKEIHDMLKSAFRVNARIAHGNPVKGRLIPD
jgi:hypothetical protein